MVYKRFDPNKIDKGYKILFTSPNLPSQLKTDFIFDELLDSLRTAFPEQNLEYLLDRLLEVKKSLIPSFLRSVNGYFTELLKELKEEDVYDLKEEVHKLRQELDQLKEIVKNIGKSKPEHEDGDILEVLKPFHNYRINRHLPQEIKLIFVFSIRFHERLIDFDKPEELCTPITLNAVFVYGKFNADKFGPYDIALHKSPYFKSHLDTYVVFKQLISFLGTMFKKDEFQYDGKRYIQVKNSLTSRLWDLIDEFFSKF